MARLGAPANRHNSLAPETPLFISGCDWGYQLRDLLLTDAPGRPIDNLVYSVHLYPRAHQTYDLDVLERQYPGVRVARFAGEWGPAEQFLAQPESEWRPFVTRLLADLDARGLGWCAWSWHDKPQLTLGGTATAWGELVRDALAARRG